MLLRKQTKSMKGNSFYIFFFEIKGMTPFWEKAVENLYVKPLHQKTTFLTNINFKWYYRASLENSIFLSV